MNSAAVGLNCMTAGRGGLSGVATSWSAAGQDSLGGAGNSISVCFGRFPHISPAAVQSIGVGQRRQPSRPPCFPWRRQHAGVARAADRRCVWRGAAAAAAASAPTAAPHTQRVLHQLRPPAEVPSGACSAGSAGSASRRAISRRRTRSRCGASSRIRSCAACGFRDACRAAGHADDQHGPFGGAVAPGPLAAA